MEYDATQFSGTTRHYLRGRPPYSLDLGDVLAASWGSTEPAGCSTSAVVPASGARLAASYGTERFEDTLARTAFGRPRTVHARGRSDIVRDVDEVIAGCLSMSFAAPHLFGPRLDDFVAKLRTLLERRSATGLFWDWPGDTKILIAVRR